MQPMDTQRQRPLVLLGDSIRIGYAPRVKALLEGQRAVVSPAANGGDSANLLRHLDEWLPDAPSGVMHFNCGLHDLKRDKATGTYQVPLAQYESNLISLVERLRRPGWLVLFATTTPIDDGRHAQRKVDFDRFEADVMRYNDVAQRVMAAQGVPVNELHAAVQAAGGSNIIGPDGTHYTPAGYDRLARAVADFIRRADTGAAA